MDVNLSVGFDFANALRLVMLRINTIIQMCRVVRKHVRFLGSEIVMRLVCLQIHIIPSYVFVLMYDMGLLVSNVSNTVFK
jgi:hypothetical protein